jgi:hypothetical protein
MLIQSEFGDVEKIENEINYILGIPLSEWLEREFFAFHVDLYMRRPIFWHLMSSRMTKCRAAYGAFSCFIHYNKITRDTIPKIQGMYISKIKEQVKHEKERVFKELESAKALKDKSRITRLSTLYEDVVDKIDELETLDTSLTKLHNQSIF